MENVVKTFAGPYEPKSALREGSPAIVAHLQEGCPSCSAGLRLFAEPAPDGNSAALDRFIQGLTAGLEGTASPVLALHAALSELAG